MIDDFPLTFFLPLVAHTLVGLTTGMTEVLTFYALKQREPHSLWGTGYLWASMVVFLTASILFVQRREANATFFFLAVIGSAFALFGDRARCFRHKPAVKRITEKRWVVIRVVEMIGSYIVLWTAFSVDSVHLIPLLNQLPPITFWLLPSVIGLPFLMLSLSRFAPKYATSSQRSWVERKGMV